MRTWSTKVPKDVRVGAAGFFQSVCQDRQELKAPFFVDAACKSDDSSAVPGEPARFENGRRPKGVTKDVANQNGLIPPKSAGDILHHEGTCHAQRGNPRIFLCCLRCDFAFPVVPCPDQSS